MPEAELIKELRELKDTPARTWRKLRHNSSPWEESLKIMTMEQSQHSL